ncbi:cholinephosphotransferase 1 [Tetranychus urticae]|uniref:Uncharacterized protein n=1 Tax=Tetranychus urticae TaxID=32264 RepID=T1K4Z1_TETUR|nr:cholinephosphotransferase 1 [Tetranychus urticae]XP_025016280.1 cholinephosphotransferase 1 [Tetranychus urticae]
MITDKDSSEKYLWQNKSITSGESNSFRKKSIARLKEFQEKVKTEVKQIEINSKKNKSNIHCNDEFIYEKSKQMNGGWVLSSHQMQFISKYPYIYCAAAGSVLELFCLQRFWTSLARFIPKFVAPSLITFIGLAINVIVSLNALYLAPQLKEEISSWTFVLCAIGTFLYQTLDALDGKQSAKVQNSQIEELTDHGCDAVSTIFVTIGTAAAFQLGYHPYLLYLFSMITLVAFFSTHWLAHTTHCMIFKKIDVSEAQWAMIITHGLTAYGGQKIWRYHILSLLGLDITLTHVIAVLTIASLINVIYDNFNMSVFGKQTPLEECGIKIPRRKSQAIYNPLYPLALLLFLSWVNYMSGLFVLNPAAFIMVYGFAFAKLVNSLVMVNVSRGEMDKWDSSLVAPLLLTINQSFIGLIHPYTALLCALVYSIMDFARYFTYSCWDLTNALDCYIFSIKYPVGHKKWRGGNEGFYINGLNNESVLKAWKKFEEEEKDGLMKELFCSD